MDLRSALATVEASGARLVLRDGKVRLYGQIPPDVRAALRAERDRVAAVLRLRELHRDLGLSEDDARHVEEELLDGAVDSITIIPTFPPWTVPTPDPTDCEVCGRDSCEDPTHVRSRTNAVN